MKKNILGMIVLGLMLFLSAPPAALGQAVYGSISGTVTDSNGAAVPRAKVTITDMGKGVNFTTVTNESGNYSQTHLIAGIYEVKVEISGFDTYVQKNVNVEVDSVAQVNARLNVGKVGEVVNVTSEAALLKTEKSDVSDTITQKAVMELPVFGRDMSRLYFLVPGVQASGTTVAIPTGNGVQRATNASTAPQSTVSSPVPPFTRRTSRLNRRRPPGR